MLTCHLCDTHTVSRFYHSFISIEGVSRTLVTLVPLIRRMELDPTEDEVSQRDVKPSPASVCSSICPERLFVLQRRRIGVPPSPLCETKRSTGAQTFIQAVQSNKRQKEVWREQEGGDLLSKMFYSPRIICSKPAASYSSVSRGGSNFVCLCQPSPQLTGLM